MKAVKKEMKNGEKCEKWGRSPIFAPHFFDLLIVQTQKIEFVFAKFICGIINIYQFITDFINSHYTINDLISIE